MSRAAVDEALESLRPGLDADGFELRLGSIRPDGDVEVILEARPTACLDCLVPEKQMVALLETAIHDRDTKLGKVILLKVGCEAS